MGIEQRLRQEIQGQPGIQGLTYDLRSRWFVGLFYVLLAIGCVFAIYQPHLRANLQVEGVMRFEQALVMSGTGSSPVALPSRWLNEPGNRNHRQYSVHFQRDSVISQDFSLYVPAVSKNFQATLNGVVLPAFGDIGEDPSWHYNRPHLLTFPPSLLVDGENNLILDVYAHSVHDGMLGVFYLGDSGLLYSYWQQEWYLSAGAAYLVFFLALIFALIAGVFSARSEPDYRLIALACVFAMLLCRRWLVVDPWLSATQHLAFAELLVSSFNFVVLLFLYRFNESTAGRQFLQRILMFSIWFVELALFFFASSIDTVYEITRWTKLLTTLSGGLLFCFALWRYGTRLNLIRLLVLCSIGVLVACGIHESLVRFAVTNVGMDYRYQWSVFFLIGTSFIYFLFDAIRQSEELDDYRGDLERQVIDYGDYLESARQRLVETQQWSVLGYSSMQLWRKLKVPLQELFESSRRIHAASVSDPASEPLNNLSNRSMYNAQRCLRTINEMELLVAEPVVELIELDMERWAPELLRELHKNFRVELRLGLVDPCTVVGDPYLLRDCIERLVDNADRACEAQRTRGIVEVSVWRSVDRVVLSVSDNGPGISAKLASRIREPLHFGEPNGLGVGLCIVKHYARLMGVDVRSLPLSKGARIDLIFRSID
ncbi:MAG: sensor histidine kinase [Granulosicoccaceae bacterium]